MVQVNDLKVSGDVDAASEAMRSPPAREREVRLLDRLQAAAEGKLLCASDLKEAQVFHLASQLLPGAMPREAERLLKAAHVALCGAPMLSASEIVRRGWVDSLPRLRQALVNRLEGLP